MVYRWGKGKGEGVLHHRDGNWDNNDPANLAVVHDDCHSRLHMTGRVVSAETRAKLSAVEKTPEWRAKIAASHRGLRASPEARAKMSAVQSGVPKSDEWKATARIRVTCPQCSYVSTKAWVTRHRRLVHGIPQSMGSGA